MARTPIKTIDDILHLEEISFSERPLEASTFEQLRNSARRFGDKTALRFLPRGTADEEAVCYSYRELAQQITRTANALHAFGVGAQDAVSLFLPNIPQMHFAFWGAEAAGIANPVNPMLDVEHIAAILNEVESKVLITLAPAPGADLWEKASAVISQVPSLHAVLTVDMSRLTPGGTAGQGKTPAADGAVQVLDFDTCIAGFPGDELQSGRIIRPDDVASYFHTGGTTGVPKIAPHTHANEVALVWQFLAVTGLDENSVGLCGLPLFHVNAVFVTGLAPWKVGAEVILATPQGYRTTALIQDFWALVERYRISYFSAVPTILAGLLQFPTQGYDLSSLEFCGCGAAPLPTELARQFEKTTGLVLLEGYGQTEGTCVSTINPRDGERPVGAVGFRLPYMGLRTVVVDDNGRAIRDCGPDEVGVIAISGPNVFGGYKQAAQNRGQWVDEGWFNTGDLGRLDDRGYLWLTGRSKDLIIRGGHNIDPQMIEEALYKHPAVAEAAAVGRPDKRVGELPVAYVQLKAQATASVEELLRFAAEQISERAAVPKDIFLIQQMPLTAVGKIFKPDLRAEAIRRVLEEELATHLGGDVVVGISVESSKQRGTVVTLRAGSDELRQRLQEVARSQLGDYALAIDIV
ncbi:MAG: acyl-CoA synthetase [Parahaliea sp.]